MDSYPPACPLMSQVCSFPSQPCPCPDNVLRGCWCRTRSEPVVPQCCTVLAPTSLSAHPHEGPTTQQNLWCAPNWGHAPGIHPFGALSDDYSCGDGSPRWGAKAGGQRGATAPPCCSYTCSKNVYNYYIRHLHSHVSATDGE